MIERYVRPPCPLSLVREPENPYDRNAIAVFYELTDEDATLEIYCFHFDFPLKPQIGYLSRDVAAKVAPLMDKGYEVNCTAIERTGDPEVEGSLGVNIEIRIRSPLSRGLTISNGLKVRYSTIIVGAIVIFGIIYCVINQVEGWPFTLIVLIPFILLGDFAINLVINPDE